MHVFYSNIHPFTFIENAYLFFQFDVSYDYKTIYGDIYICKFYEFKHIVTGLAVSKPQCYPTFQEITITSSCIWENVPIKNTKNKFLIHIYSINSSIIVGTLPVSHKNVTLTACTRGFIECCEQEVLVTVKNCGDFNVYYLLEMQSCAARYCFGMYCTFSKCLTYITPFN